MAPVEPLIASLVLVSTCLAWKPHASVGTSKVVYQLIDGFFSLPEEGYAYDPLDVSLVTARFLVFPDAV